MGADQIVLEQWFSKDRLLYSQWGNWVIISTLKNKIQPKRKEQGTWPIVWMLFHKTSVTYTYSHTGILYKYTYIYMHKLHILGCDIKSWYIKKKKGHFWSNRTSWFVIYYLFCHYRERARVPKSSKFMEVWERIRFSYMFKDLSWITETPRILDETYWGIS